MAKEKSEPGHGQGDEAIPGTCGPEHQFEEILSGLNNGIIVFDHTWHHAFINDKALAIPGKRREELSQGGAW